MPCTMRVTISELMVGTTAREIDAMVKPRRIVHRARLITRRAMRDP